MQNFFWHFNSNKYIITYSIFFLGVRMGVLSLFNVTLVVSLAFVLQLLVSRPRRVPWMLSNPEEGCGNQSQRESGSVTDETGGLQKVVPHRHEEGRLL